MFQRLRSAGFDCEPGTRENVPLELLELLEPGTVRLLLGGFAELEADETA